MPLFSNACHYILVCSVGSCALRLSKNRKAAFQAHCQRFKWHPVTQNRGPRPFLIPRILANNADEAQLGPKEPPN